MLRTSPLIASIETSILDVLATTSLTSIPNSSLEINLEKSKSTLAVITSRLVLASLLIFSKDASIPDKVPSVLLKLSPKSSL